MHDRDRGTIGNATFKLLPQRGSMIQQGGWLADVNSDDV